MIFLRINSTNFTGMAWCRHTKFQIGIAAVIAMPLLAPLKIVFAAMMTAPTTVNTIQVLSSSSSSSSSSQQHQQQWCQRLYDRSHVTAAASCPLLQQWQWWHQLRHELNTGVLALTCKQCVLSHQQFRYKYSWTEYLYDNWSQIFSTPITITGWRCTVKHIFATS